MLKIFKVADIRELQRQHMNEEISYSRMVEIMNEMASDKFITPIICRKTKQGIRLGEKVIGAEGKSGTLHFDDYTNQYVIKTSSGGHLKSSFFEISTEAKEYKPDTTSTECRARKPKPIL